jgi:ABC-type multidrug transport system ATPase subunit
LCSHILSDVEVLCDRIAIMKRGRLVETGRIEELRERNAGASGNNQSNQFEIMLAGVGVEEMRRLLPSLDQSNLSSTASGARIEVANERNRRSAGSATANQQQARFNSTRERIPRRIIYTRSERK